MGDIKICSLNVKGRRDGKKHAAVIRLKKKQFENMRAVQCVLGKN